MRFEEKMPYEDSDVEIIKDILKFFYFYSQLYSQLYSQYVIISSVGNKVGKKVGDKKPLNSRRQKIISEMRDNPNITTAELHNILGVSETAVENNISFLRENGYIERVGSKKAGYWKVL